MNASIAQTTLRQLMAHRSGLLNATLGSINPAMDAMNDTVAMLDKYHSGCPDKSARPGAPRRHADSYRDGRSA
jgi:CubicO group peptidase (beta-lactamase class C family)